jgi:hypothetical protein
MPNDFNWGKRKLSPEESNLLFCSPTFVQQYMCLFDFSDPLSAKSSSAKDRLLEQVTEQDVDRFIEEGRKVKKQFLLESGGDLARGSRKPWWKFWR